MQALKWLLGILLGLVAIIFGVGLSLPGAVHVERSITVKASPDAVFAVLNGYRRFNEWSPWAELDPQTRYRYEGPDNGVGAKLSWQSDNPNVGSGSQEILESVPLERVRSRLRFDGFDGDSQTSFQLAPDADGTRVAWAYDKAFDGNLLGRYVGLKMDSWIGADYEKGLARLKHLLESEAVPEVGADAVESGSP